jgi:transcriptional regulator with XRE-family HTH domain
MVHFPQSGNNRGAEMHRGDRALDLRTQSMATALVSTPIAGPVPVPMSGSVSASVVQMPSREVIRCEHCLLVQYRTKDSNCRRCHKSLDMPEPAPAPSPMAVVGSKPVAPETEAGLQVAVQVKEIRRARHLSQRQLAGRMQVPRTYISKIENGKAIPTLGSLERIANALEVDVCQLVRDTRSRREEEVSTIFADPFLAEVAQLLPRLDSLQRTLFLGAVRDKSTGQRRTA